MNKTAKKSMLEDLPLILKDTLELIPMTEDAVRDRAKRDWNGQNTEALAGHFRFLGIAFYVQNDDKAAFREKLTRAVELTQSMFDRYAAGEQISVSYLSLLTYHDIFDALAVGRMDLAEKLAQSMGNLGEHERTMVHPFDYAFGYALKYFVLNDATQMPSWTTQFSETCRQTDSGDFLGYADVFQAILDRDVAAAQSGFERIIVGHKRQSKGRGVFALREDQLLCVWGIGLANLCRDRGLPVQGIPPLIPGDLLI